MLTTIASFGITKFRLQSALCWFTVRKLFVLNCAVLVLNVLFYLVNNVLIPSSIEVHFMPSLDFYDRDLLDLTFQAFTEAMDSNNVTYFVFGGTLLGSWRHHGRIPWDDDIDVMVNFSESQTVSRVLRSRGTEDPASFGLYDSAKRSDDFADQWKFYPRNGRGLYHNKFKSPYIDIFFYRANETHIWSASPISLTSEVWLKSDVFPLRRRPYGNLMVPAPCNPGAFLGVYFNISVCETRSFNHVSDTHLRFEPIQVPCSRLAHLYPFVHRTNTSKEVSAKFVMETLSLGHLTLGRFKARTCC